MRLEKNERRPFWVAKEAPRKKNQEKACGKAGGTPKGVGHGDYKRGVLPLPKRTTTLHSEVEVGILTRSQAEDA